MRRGYQERSCWTCDSCSREVGNVVAGRDAGTAMDDGKEVAVPHMHDEDEEHNRAAQVGTHEVEDERGHVGGRAGHMDKEDSCTAV